MGVMVLMARAICVRELTVSPGITDTSMAVPLMVILPVLFTETAAAVMVAPARSVACAMAFTPPVSCTLALMAAARAMAL
jgi:hypothetical protein